jgi:two-component sensor histidine kinase
LSNRTGRGRICLTIVRQAVAPHDPTERGGDRWTDPEVRLSPSQAVSMSLIIHELGANAVKYGAHVHAGGDG